MELTLYHKINFINVKRRYFNIYESIHKMFTNGIEKGFKIFKNFKNKFQNFEISP